MKKLLTSLSLMLFAVLLLPGMAGASSYYVSGSTGIDISYPNCRTKLPSTSFGIVGVTGGLVYSANNCLAQEAGAFKDLSLYVNTGLNADASSTYYQAAATSPKSCNGDVYCQAYNYGYNAGLDAVKTAQAAGVSSTRWWLDVENGNTWNADVMQNRQSLQGEYDALVANGASLVGVYSTTAQWQEITNGWQNQWPSWGATTWTTASQAQKYCTGHEFTGGPSLLMQFMSKRSKVDQDVAC